MVTVFKGETVNDVWLGAAKTLKEKCKMSNELLPSRNGNMVEVCHSVFDINNPHERFLLCRKPSISIAAALSEIICILKGSNDAKILNYWNSGLQEHAGNAHKYHGAYGYRLRKEFGIDQIKRVYIVLKNNPKTRQAVMLLWNPIEDLPHSDGSPKNSDIPCNIVSLLKIRSNKLIWSQIMRSNDIFLGTPYNFIQFTFLQEIIAGWLQIETGEYTLFCDSLHYYEEDFAKELYSQTIPNNLLNTDVFNDEYKITNNNVNYIYSVMEDISKNKFSTKKAEFILINSKLDTKWNNILFILIAYYAHKNNNITLQNKILLQVKNNIYLYLWNMHFNKN